MKHKENDRNTQEVYEKVYDHFKGDKKKADEWFYNKHKGMNKEAIRYIGDNNAKQLNEYVDRNLRNKK